jgi:hypothetical protein
MAKDASDEPAIEVTPLRLFPRSDPDHWIALLDHDGHELGCLDDPKILDEASGKWLQQVLVQREFVPVIQRITWVSGNSEPCEWRVETDRGPTEFILKEEQDIRRLGTHGVLVLDAHRIRYLIPDRRALDDYSQRIVEWYV